MELIKVQTMQLVLIMTISLLVLGSCQVVDLYSLWMDLPPDSVLFQDDFTDPTSGWKNSADSDFGAKYYENGTYRIMVNSDNSLITSTPGLRFKDVRVFVTASKLSGPDDDIYGILCRYQDTNNYYFLVISSDGYYGIGKTINGQQTLIGDEKMPPSDAIHQGFSTNHLRAECAGDQLSLYVNGVHLSSVSDSNLPSGDVGLFAGTYSEPGLEIMFSNFSVLKP
jgi:hypothetical protein